MIGKQFLLLTHFVGGEWQVNKTVPIQCYLNSGFALEVSQKFSRGYGFQIKHSFFICKLWQPRLG